MTSTGRTAGDASSGSETRPAAAAGLELEVPSNLACAARAEGRQAWLATVPAIVSRVAERWGLRVGRPFTPGGQTAWVAPATTRDGQQRVVKVGWRHPESDGEADALAEWAGRGAVLLHEVEDLGDTVVLLLERADPGTALSEVPEPVQDEVIAALLPRLWITPSRPERFRPLSVMCQAWAEQFERARAAGQVTLDPGLAEAGIELFRSLPDTAERSVLLATDLHAGNVLAARREPWLAVDPKPYLGDPTYDVLQHLYNCEERLAADPVGLVERMAGLLDLDPERLRLWLFARSVQESPGWPGAADIVRRLAP